MQRQLAPGNQRWLTPWEAVPLLVVAALIGFQLFVPPVIGMADNGDFAKVAARVCLQPPPDLLHSPERYWHYFLTTYEVAPQHCLAFWSWSSMVPIVWVAKQLHDLVGKEAYFDTRAIGAVCTVLWLACMWGMLRLLRRAPVAVQITAAAASLAVLTDVLYVAYFQSFYADCAAMIFLFSTCLLGWRAAQTHCTSWILSFAASAILLILSKSPHIMLVPWLIVFAVFLWWRSRSRAWMLTAALLMIPVGITLSSLPYNIKAETFDVIFARLLPTAKDPVAVLAEFGFPPEAVRYSGEYVYTPTTPFKDEKWRAQNAGSLTSERLIAFYARHPGWMVHNLWEDLERNASRMRFLGNYRREDGQPPDHSAPSLLGWSNLRSFLLRKMPWHMPLFYLAVLIGGAAWALRGAESWQQIGGALCFALAGMSLTEFVVNCLFEALETGRHLFFFHVLTDALLVQAALAVAWFAAERWPLQRIAAASLKGNPVSEKIGKTALSEQPPGS